MDVRWQRYVITFFITITLFAFAFYFSGVLAEKKIDEVRVIQDKISTDILSTETKFILLGSSSCESFESGDEFESGLNNELSEMANRVKFMENQLGSDDERVLLIKNQYVLLQIKDYVLRKQLTTRCRDKNDIVLYFHDTDCADCKEQSIVLDEIHDQYPNVRIYWFDNSSTTPALRTLTSMFKVSKFPTIVVNEKSYAGFQPLDALQGIFDKTQKPKIDNTKKPTTKSLNTTN